MLKVSQEMDFDDLQRQCWSGALDTLKRVSDEGLEDELLNFLEEAMDEPTLTEVNDFLWFDDDYIFESLGITEEEEE